jgi:hypothetical protein
MPLLALGLLLLYIGTKAVLWLRQLVAGLSHWKPEFAPWSVHAGYIEDKESGTGTNFSPISSGFALSIFLPWFSILTYNLGMKNTPTDDRSSET